MTTTVSAPSHRRVRRDVESTQLFQQVLRQYLEGDLTRYEIRKRFGLAFKKRVTRAARRLRTKDAEKRRKAITGSNTRRIRRHVAYHQEGTYCPWPPDPNRRIGSAPSIRSLCCWCRRELAFNQMTLEHIVPLRDGGAHAPRNLAIACAPCNSARSKSAFTQQPPVGSLWR